MTSASIRMFKRFSWHVFCSCHSENTFFCSCHSAPKWPRAEYTIEFYPPPQNDFSASAQSSFCACVPGPQLALRHFSGGRWSWLNNLLPCASRGNSGLGRRCGRSASAEPRRRGSCCACLAYVLSCCSDVSAALAGPFPLGTETWPLALPPLPHKH